MNSFQLMSIFLSSFISIGSSVLLLLYSTLNKDLTEVNILVSCIVSSVNIYTLYSYNQCDELGYPNDYKAREVEDTYERVDDNVWSVSNEEEDTIYEIKLSS